MNRPSPSSLSESFKRIEQLYDIRRFENSHVLVVGCGSGGSGVALQLALAGVSHFTLIDPDVLEPENVIRHACGIRYLNQPKVEALADVIRDRNPIARIDAIRANIHHMEHFEELVRGADTVVLATDNDPSRFLLNEICVKNRKPFAVGRVFTRGIGGEAFVFRPKGGACLACLEAYLQRSEYREGIHEIDLLSEEEREKLYGMEKHEVKDSPGLALDISFIVGFHSRFMLDILLQQTTPPLDAFPPLTFNYVVWGNRPVPPFKKYFQIRGFDLTPQDGCLVCANGTLA